ncbi:MAG: hypothetical protein Q8O85_07995 [Rhodoferax sp.]|nr:hypothetical protein [Rhodoferax sp.]MDP2678648.1 hypothetical protein [Rhodoferax sp.]
MTDNDKELIRNITAEFLIFTCQSGEQSIDVRNEGITVPHTRNRGRLE